MTKDDVKKYLQESYRECEDTMFVSDSTGAVEVMYANIEHGHRFTIDVTNDVKQDDTEWSSLSEDDKISVTRKAVAECCRLAETQVCSFEDKFIVCTCYYKYPVKAKVCVSPI